MFIVGSFAKDRQFALYNLAELLLRDGQIGAAEQYATEAYQLRVAEETADNHELATAILRLYRLAMPIDGGAIRSEDSTDKIYFLLRIRGAVGVKNIMKPDCGLAVDVRMLP